MVPALRAGVGRAVITPPVGIAHAGWGVQTHQRAEGIDMDLPILGLHERLPRLRADHRGVSATAAYPDGGYEVDASPFRPGSDERLVEASLALLSDLRT
jgi:hypothetical protein